MKKLSSFLIFIVSLHNIPLFATSLIPSLDLQMKRQERINIENRAFEKKQLNSSKLTALKRLRQTKIYASSSVASRTFEHIQKPTAPIRTEFPYSNVNLSYSVNTEIPWVDMDRVRSTWNSWYTDVRANLGLSGYTYDKRLDRTASDWNEVFAAGNWLNHHRRSPTDSYYNYSKITDWFRARGVVGKLIGGATTTENVGYGYYRCSSSDCTDTLISSIRSTFDFFMSEKWKSYDAHYRSIVQPHFTKIGLAISVIPSENRYYMTIHYITEFE